MSETYICDNCDSRIDSGHTVSWADELTDGPSGIHWSRKGNRTVNLCDECWPDEDGGEDAAGFVSSILPDV